jgi:hypothetical protein
VNYKFGRRFGRRASLAALAMTSLLLAAPAAEAARKPVTSLRSGLYCRDLKRLGYTYGQALQYWEYWGEPDNMDADLNGIPCETIYTAAQVRRYFP